MKKMSKMLALSAASVMGLSAFSSANAAVLVTIDVRQATTNSKSIEITAPGQAITLNVYAEITNNNGDHSDDSIAAISLRFNSIEDATAALQGNLSSATAASAFNLGSNGAQTQYDANPDFEWGGTATNSAVNNFTPTSAVQQAGSGAGTGPTEVLLGTITWTQNGLPLVPGTFTDVNAVIYANLAGNGSFQLKSDGTLVSNQNAAANEAVTGPVHLFVAGVAIPEPASIGVLGMGALALVARRRRK